MLPTTRRRKTLNRSRSGMYDREAAVFQFTHNGATANSYCTGHRLESNANIPSARLPRDELPTVIEVYGNGQRVVPYLYTRFRGAQRRG